MRQNSLPSLQRTYDNCHMTCSTAIYFENQGNENVALEYWKRGLDQVHEYRVMRPFSPNARSDPEKDLLNSLRDLELQCKERIDLLEALRVSRLPQALTPSSSSSPPDVPRTTGASRTKYNATTEAAATEDGDNEQEASKGFIGDGTIRAMSYPELPRPRRETSSPPCSSRPTPIKHMLPSTVRQQTRSSSLDKLPHVMRTTLRGPKTDECSKYSPSRRSLLVSAERPGASKAATVAWSREVPVRSSRLELSRAVSSTGTAASRRTVVADNSNRNSSSSISSSSSSSHSDDATRNPLTHKMSRSLENESLERQSQTLASPAARSAASHALYSPATSGGIGTAAARYSSGSPRMPRTYTPKSIAAASIAAAASMARASRHYALPGALSGALAVTDTTISHVTDTDLAPDTGTVTGEQAWENRKAEVLKRLPPGVNSSAAKQILNEIFVHGDEVHWDDIAGLEPAKAALRETVVYPFLRPDLFMGLREPARGMLLFGPPGTGKTMLARAVATESSSTFFSISASSLTSKWMGESEKLVRALFALAKLLAPSIIFVDEIDSLLGQRSGRAGEHEATTRIKTEFLIQWSDLQRAAAGRCASGSSSPAATKRVSQPRANSAAASVVDGDGDDTIGSAVKEKSENKPFDDANRVLVLAATNLPWAIDEAARRRFVRRQYIPLPETDTRKAHFKRLLGQQKHSLEEEDIDKLVELTHGFSGSDITALAKDAAMGPLRALGEAVLTMKMEEIRPISLQDFESSLKTIRPSVSQDGLEKYEEWARMFEILRGGPKPAVAKSPDLCLSLPRSLRLATENSPE